MVDPEGGYGGLQPLKMQKKRRKERGRRKKRVNLNQPKNTVRENVSAVFVLMSEML